MSQLNNKISVINEHSRQIDWLLANNQYVQMTLYETLNTDHYAYQAVEIVLNVQQTILDHKQIDHLEQSIKLLYEALLVVQRLRDNYTQVRIWIAMGRTYALLQRANSARTAFNVALERTEQEQDWELMLQLYIEIFQLHQQDQLGDVLAYQVDQAKKIADDLGNATLIASLSQYLAMAYGFRGDIEEAEKYADDALKYWTAHGNALEMAHTAFSMAASYRAVGKIHLANEFLEQAVRLYTSTDDRRQQATIPFEYAQQLIEVGDYHAAYEQLEKSCQGMNRLPASIITARDKAACLYTMGNLSMWMGGYEQAEIYLLDAFDHWQNYADPYHHTLLYYSLSQLHIQRKDYQSAQDCILQAQNHLPKIPQSPRANSLKQIVTHTVSLL